MSESIDLKLNFDISSFLGQLSNAKEQVSSLKAELEETPGTPKALNAGLDRTQHTINMLEKKAHAVNKLSDGRKDAVAEDLMAGLEEINISTQLFSGGGTFSTNLAKQMFAGFPDAVRREQNSNTKEIEKLIRSFAGSFTSLGASNMAREIQMTDDAKKIYGTRFKKTSSDQFAKYIEMQLPHALPAYMMEEYQMLSKGTASQIYASIHPHEMIPKTFQAAFKNKKYISSGSSNALFMQEEQRKMLRNLISENDAAMRAAEKVDGMIRRSTAGRAQLNRNITQAQYDQFKSNMWKDWILRASGSQSSRIDLFADNLSTSDERKLLSRMTGSSAGRVLSAMNSLDPFETAAAWATSTKQKGYETLKKEARRELEQYEIARFRFGDVFSGKEKWRPVALSESQNTRLLGQSGMHNQFTDKVAVLDLVGYDKENKEHQKLLEQLSSGKEVSLPGSNKKYIAQNLHGTGRNTTFRLIEAEAYKTVRDREKAWLEQQGFVFSGNNYWNNLVGEDYVFESEEALRKHYDATGKGWTPGYQVKSQQKDKNFGIVDFSKISDAGQKAKQADGLAWMAKGILPEGSIQARLGISGKGVVNEMPFKTMGDWAVNAGLIKPGERFILPGPRGDVDVTDQNGISDVSQVKNISAYGNFKSGEEMNRAFTALMQRYGISTVTSFGNAESKVDSLGHQAMMFMKLSPEIVEKQMAAADRRLKMLDTEAGIREFILSDPNDYLAKMLREGRIQPTDNVIQSRVQKEKDSIISRLVSGEWLDFDGSVSGYNQKVNKTLMTSLVEFGGGSREEKIQKLRKLMKDKGLTREYTDDEIAGIWGLGGVKGGAIVDFLRPEEEFVAVNRAPNGIAQFVSGKNYAKLARDVYKKFGISTNGVFLSEEDMLTLGDADFDGDGVKVMYGDTAHEMGRASDLYNEIINKLAITSNAQHVKDDNIVSGSVTDTPEQRRRAAEDSVAAVMAMGLTSSAGEKATMFDLTDPRNRDMLIAAVQANPAYSIATVLGKKGGHVELTKEMWAASRQGKTWQKQPSKYSNLFNVTGKDDMDIPDDERIYVSNEGIKVNQDQQEEMDIDTINLPSANQDSTQVGLRIASQIGASPEGQKRKRAILEALDKVVGYGEFGEKTKAFMQNMRGLKLGMATGDRGITTKEEDEILAMQLSEAYKEVADLAKSKLIDGGGGKVRLEDGTEKKYGEYLSELQKKAGIDVARAYLYSYGATADRIIKTYGEEEGTKIVEDVTSHNGVDLMNTKVSSAEELLNPQKPVAQQENTVATSSKGKKPKSRKAKQAQRNAKKAEEATQAAEEKIDDSISIFEQYEKIKTFEGSLQAEKELSEYISEVSGKWYKIHTKVDEDPEKSFYALSLYQQRKAQNEYDIASTHGDSAVFGSGTATGENLFASQQGMEANYFLATRAHLTQSGESALESLRNSVQGVGDEFDKQQATLEKWSSEVESLQKQLDAFKESREQYSSKANSDLEADTQAIGEQEKRINEAKQLEKQGRENLLKSNDLRFSEDIDQLMYQLTGKTAGRQEKISREIELRKMQLEIERASMEEAYNKKLLSDESYKKLLPRFDEVSKYIDEEYRKRLETQYTDKTHKEVASFIRHGDRMDLAHRRRAIDNTMYGRYLAQTENELEQRRHYDEMGTLKLEELKNAQAPQTEIDKLTKSLNRNKEAMEGLEKARGKLSAGFQMLDDAVTRVITRQGKQLLSKAMNELKRFTLEFSADMTEIQAITMKSDDEMTDVRQNTLDDAIKYRTSVSNVSSVRKDLYRQGLSDAEVDERSGSILKFAKVTAIKTQDATKIITTAQQNNLVSSAEEAMDALVALGDNAATTATEIGNAMQKCAAAAKVAGVSYSELTPMLATMTSMTQLSGKQVGTAMNTILTRLHNVTANNYTKEINGEVTSLNDVEKALGTIGVSLRDDDGGWRKSTDVLLNIAERWQSMTDIQKSLVSTSVAATRSGNMFQTLMEGMSEDGGKQFEEYLNLAENSEGITNKKYEVSVRSLSAAIDTLTASYDKLISGIESSQIGQTVLDFVSGVQDGISDLNENIPALGKALTMLIPTLAIVAGLAVLIKGRSSSLSLLTGIGVAGLGMWVASGIGHSAAKEDPEARNKTIAESYSNTKSAYIKSANSHKETAVLINDTKKLGEEYVELGENMKEASSNKLEDNLHGLIELFPEQSKYVDDNGKALENWKTITEEAAIANEKLTKSEIEKAEIQANIAANANYNREVSEKINEVKSQYAIPDRETLDRLTEHDGFYISSKHRAREGYILEEYNPNDGDKLSDYVNLDHLDAKNKDKYNQLFEQAWKNRYAHYRLSDEEVKQLGSYGFVQGERSYGLDSIGYYGNAGHESSKEISIPSLATRATLNEDVKKILEYIDSGKVVGYEGVEKVVEQLAPFKTNISADLFYPLLDENVFDNILAEAISGDVNYSSGYYTGIKSEADAYNLINSEDGYSNIPYFEDTKVLDNLIYTLYEQNLLGNTHDWGYADAQEFVDDAKTGFEKANERGKDVKSIKDSLAKAIFLSINEDSYLKKYLDVVYEAVIEAYESEILRFIEQYSAKFYLNPNAGADFKSAVYNVLRQNAPKTQDGDIDWAQVAETGYLQTAVPEAVLQVENEGVSKWADAESRKFYWDRSSLGYVNEGFDTLEEAFLAIDSEASFAGKYDADWANNQRKKILYGGDGENAGTRAYHTQSEYADLAYQNWLSENPQRLVDFEKIIDAWNESSDFADFESKISDDTNLAGVLNSRDKLTLAWRSAKNENGAISDEVFKRILLSEYSGQDMLAHSDYMDILAYGFGEGWEDQIASGEYVVDDEARERYQTALQDPAFNEYLDQAISKYEGLGEVVKALTGETEQTTDAQKALAEVFRNTALSESQKYNKNLSKITDTLSALSKGGKNAEDAVQDLNQQMKQRDYAQYSLNAFKKGKATSNDLSVLSDFFGIDEEQLKKASKDMGSETSQWMLQSMMAELASYDQDLADVFEKSVLVPINNNFDTIWQKGIELGNPIAVNGQVDVSALLAAIDAAGIQMTDTMRQYIATLSLVADEDSVSIKFNQEGQKRKSGGGGGGKSKTEKFIEDLKKKLTTREHLIKMIQYQETKYENRGEFGNLNRMISLENDAQSDLRSTLEENLVSLKKQIASTKQGSDDWYSLREEILATEEAIEDANIAIEENIEKMKENEEAIRQTRIALEEMVNSEIENRIQKERDMLEGSVSMQDMILDSIKQRYQDEWDLVKKDIDKKREALEEEKALIDERLNARKEAEDEAAKYEELAEYNKQLALISMDSTRTKDAAELRNKIAELEKELAWDVAEDEAEAQKQKIDDEITAYDQYVLLGDEDMQAFLEDANNFADEVKNVLGLSHDDLMEWLKTNIKEYTKSLEDAKKQMLQSWDDLYKQMYGITDTYWEEIANILSSKDSFLDYMKESEEYVNASETDRASMLYEWGEAYDDYVAALKQDAEYSHSDEEYGMSSASTSPTDKKTPKDKGPSIPDILKNGASNLAQWFTSGQAAKDIGNGIRTGLGLVQTALGIKTVANMIPGFSSGGDVNYTGLAMVHGTPSRPEAFLSADDRIMIRTLIDSFGYARYTPKSFAYDMDNSSASAKIEEVNVTINQAELGSDEDIENTARKVGDVFARELAKAGFNTTKIGF